MAKFKFRLEPILKMRKSEQEQCERSLAESIGHMLNAQAQVERVDGQIDQLYQSIRRGLAGPLEIGALIGERVWLNRLHRVRYSEGTNLADHQHRVEQAKRELAEAKRRTDIMFKLRENAKAKFHAEQNRKETVALDDLTNSKYAWHQQVAKGGQE